MRDSASNGAKDDARRAGRSAQYAAEFDAAQGAHRSTGGAGQRADQAQDATGEVTLAQAV